MGTVQSPILPNFWINYAVFLHFHFKGVGRKTRCVLGEVVLYFVFPCVQNIFVFCLFVCLFVCLFFDRMTLILSFKCDINSSWYFDVSLYYYLQSILQIYHVIQLCCCKLVLMKLNLESYRIYVTFHSRNSPFLKKNKKIQLVTQGNYPSRTKWLLSITQLLKSLANQDKVNS